MAESGLGQRLLLLLVCLAVCLTSLSFAPSKPSAPAKEATAGPPWKYNGSGSCSATPCHGETKQLGQKSKDHTRRGVLQNEYYVWAANDPHFGSYNVLQSPRAKQMMSVLRASYAQNHSTSNAENYSNGQVPKWKADATDEPRCRACHALTAIKSDDLEARHLENEGIGCENCHGPSSGWFGSHFKTNWTTEDSIKCGLNRIDDPIQRATICLGCHLGKEGQEVDHEMIAAGHPDLFFEMDLFSAKEPRHWEEPPDWTEPKQRKEPGPWGDSTHDANFKVRLWAVGQAVQLQEALNRLKRRIDHGQWPEFSELDCFSCHHPVRSNLLDPPFEARSAGWPSNIPDSWRQANGYEGRTAGSPSWNRAHYTVFLIMLKEIDPNNSDQLEIQLNNLFRVASQLKSSPDTIKSSVNAAFDLVSKTVATVNRRFDKPTLARILLSISRQGQRIAAQDTRSAEQAYMALDSLFHCFASKTDSQNSVNGSSDGHPEKSQYSSVWKAMDELYQQFDNPSSYDAPRFQRGMEKVHHELVAAGVGTR